jgi:hypothetical protein
MRLREAVEATELVRVMAVEVMEEEETAGEGKRRTQRRRTWEEMKGFTGA